MQNVKKKIDKIKDNFKKLRKIFKKRLDKIKETLYNIKRKGKTLQIT